MPPFFVLLGLIVFMSGPRGRRLLLLAGIAGLAGVYIVGLANPEYNTHEILWLRVLYFPFIVIPV